MSAKRLLALFVLLTASVACGRGSEDTTLRQAPAASATASPQDQQAERVDPRKGGLQVGFGEFAITLEAEAISPGPVTFVIHNGGKLTHGFEIKSEGEGGGSNSGSGGGGDDEFKIESATFGAGDTIRVRASLPAGVYEVECYVADHDELGMRTLLHVRNDAPLLKPKSIGGNEVLVSGFAYDPGTIEVVGGTKVVWTNEDPTEHTVTSKDGSFGSDPFGNGESFSFTFETPGEYAYYCAIHPAMHGSVRVTG